VVPLDAFKPSRSLRRIIDEKRFTISINAAFEQVIRACSLPRSAEKETWLSEEIIEAFLKLHRLGVAHSVESWQNGELAGGLYGIAMGGAFFGESMFFIRPNASKAAFAWLVAHLKRKGYLLLDAQIMNPHLERLGAIEIPHDDYMLQLETALTKKIPFI
jgi:leucyl/phenylalanyl-tRNA--protein transferase